MQIRLHPTEITLGPVGITVYERDTPAVAAYSDDVRFNIRSRNGDVTLDAEGMDRALTALVALLKHPGKPYEKEHERDD